MANKPWVIKLSKRPVCPCCKEPLEVVVDEDGDSRELIKGLHVAYYCIECDGLVYLYDLWMEGQLDG